VLTALYWRNK